MSISSENAPVNTDSSREIYDSLFEDSTDYSDTLVSLFPPPVSASRPSEKIPLEDLVSLMRGEEWSDITRQSRELYLSDEKEYKSHKASSLSYVTFSVISPNGHRIEHAESVTGLLGLDWDGKDYGPDFDVSSVLDTLKSSPYVVMAFISPSGNGVKAVIAVEKISNSNIAHKNLWTALDKYYAELTGYNSDPKCKNINRACFMTHDPDMYVNFNASPYIRESKSPDVEFESEDTSTEKPKPKAKSGDGRIIRRLSLIHI